jgi:hypothetical protein
LIVLDTNILVYATGAEHEFREPTVRLLAAIGEGSVHASTTHFVIQEFAHVRARRWPRREAVVLARDLGSALAPLIAVDDAVLDRGLGLFERYRLGAFDAILAAAALEAGVDALVSADSSFAQVPRLRHVVPATPAFNALFGS